jgi:hypothetical protein
MAQELKITPGMGYTQERVTRLIGWLTIGAAGAISAQAVTAVTGQGCGITWTRNAAGDYRGTLHRGYKRVINAGGRVTMPALATAPTLAAGNDVFIQGVLAANFIATALSTLGLTTTRTDTQVLADPTNGVTITYDIELSDGG